MINSRTASRLLIKDPRAFLEASFDILNKKGLLHWMSDATFLRSAYWLRFGKKLNLKNPRSFNEKLQWLKLYDHRPEYIEMVDKLAMKSIVTKMVGKDYIIPTLGTYQSPDEVAWDSLPNQFVLKWNHDSGSIVICKDKESFNKDEAIKKLRHGEKINGFWYGREWPYKSVKPLLLAEKYMEDNATHELRDYKVFTFDGRAKLLLIASDRQTKGESVKFDYFDAEGNHLNIVNDHPQAHTIPQLPSNFHRMFELAETIAVGYPHLRVDFYEVNDKLFIGEFTLYHGSGLMSFIPEEWETMMGDWITLPQKQR